MDWRGEQDYITDNGERGRSQYERTAFLSFLRQDSNDNGQDRGYSVRRDSEELSLCGSIAELVDDGWEEEGECVEGKRHGVES